MKKTFCYMFDILYQNTLLGRLFVIFHTFKDDFLWFYTFLNLSSG